jgi:recombination protein RecT
MAKELAKKGKDKTLAEYLVEHKGIFNQILPAHVGVERFLRITLSAVYSNPKLAACDFKSMLFACKEAAQLGLEPNGVLGHAAIIPYMNRKKTPPRYEAHFQVMYKGILDLAHRSGQIEVITAKEVYEQDLFEYEHGFEQKLRHIPAEGSRGDVTKYYAYYILKGGGRDFVVITKEQAAAHGKHYSKAYNDKESPWQTSFDSMAKKTALLMLLKYAPLSIEIPQEMQREIQEIKTNIIDADFETSELEEEKMQQIEEKQETEKAEIVKEEKAEQGSLLPRDTDVPDEDIIY